MSQYGDGDPAAVYETEWRKARKEHTCDACSESIRPGARYLRTFVVHDGNAYSIRRCERCQAIHAHLSARIRAEGDSEEFCDDELNCGHDYRDRWDEEPPEEIAALAFWRPGDPLPNP